MNEGGRKRQGSKLVKVVIPVIKVNRKASEEGNKHSPLSPPPPSTLPHHLPTPSQTNQLVRTLPPSFTTKLNYSTKEQYSHTDYKLIFPQITLYSLLNYKIHMRRIISLCTEAVQLDCVGVCL